MADVIEYLDKPVEEILDNWNFRHKLRDRIIGILESIPSEGGGGTITSVNGQTGPVVSLTTTNIPEGTNLYFTTVRARQSVFGGIGISYDNTTGVITNTGVLSETDPIFTASDAFGIDSTDIGHWDSAYNNMIVSAGFTGTTTKTLTLTQQDGGTLTATFTDNDTTYTAGTGISIVGTVISNTGVITETDPVFTSSYAFGITGIDINNWNEAYDNYPTGIKFSGTSTITLDMFLKDGSTLSDSFSIPAASTPSWQDTVDVSNTVNKDIYVTNGAFRILGASTAYKLYYLGDLDGLNNNTYALIDDNTRKITLTARNGIVLPTIDASTGAYKVVVRDDSDGVLRYTTISPGGSGTVTSVDLTAPSIFSVSGNPITTSGTIALSLANQLQNRVFASPNGSTGAPIFRTLVMADLPTISTSDISGFTTDVRTSLSGTNGVSYNNSTGVMQMDSSYTGNFQFNGRLTVVNTGSTVAEVAVGSTSTFSVGLGSTASGALIQGYNGSTVSAARFLQINPSGGNVMIGTGADGGEKFQVVGTVAMDLGSDATGDIYYRNASGTFTRLAIGSAGTALVVSGSNLPAWTSLTSSNISGFSTSVTGLFSESGNELTYSSGVISTNKAVQTLSNTTPVIWNVASGYNATITLTANRTLSISNAVAGEYYTLRVVQDGTGSRTLTMPSGTKVANAGGGIVTLSTAANAIDLLTFYYDGTNYYVNKGANYT